MESAAVFGVFDVDFHSNITYPIECATKITPTSRSCGGQGFSQRALRTSITLSFSLGLSALPFLLHDAHRIRPLNLPGKKSSRALPQLAFRLVLGVDDGLHIVLGQLFRDLCLEILWEGAEGVIASLGGVN